jgi:multidrug resistance efflux pump
MVSAHMTNDLSTRPAEIVSEERRPAPASLSDRVRSLRLKEKTSPARARFAWFPWTLCALFAVAAGAMGYLAYTRFEAPRSNESSAAQENARSTETSRNDYQTASSGEMVLERKGYVIPAHQILVSPKVSGMIVQLGDGKRDLEEGMRVQKDDVLAVVESINYQADYDHCKAAVNSAWQKFIELYTGNREQEIRQARGALDEMEANRKQLYLDWQRNSRLRGTAIAERDMELAESLYKAMDRKVEQMRQAYSIMLEGVRVERIEAAWADLELAEADMIKAKWNLDNCIIRAPVSGTILTKKAEIGNLVNPIAFNGSTSLCEMADLSDLEIDISIEEREVSKIFKGQLCKVRPEGFPERVYDGHVSRLMPTADRAKSAIPVRVKLKVPKAEEGVYLKPESGAIVVFLKKTEPPSTKK